MRATELPIHGNPYPPKDAIINHTPGFLELKVRAIRTSIQPYTTPIKAAFEKTNDVLAIGASHTQSSLQSLIDNQNAFSSAMLIAASGLLSLTLVRRRGIFTKFIVTSVATAGAAGVCFPNEAREKAELLVYIAKNKLPTFVSEQYKKMTSHTQSSAKLITPDNSTTSSEKSS